MEFLEHFILIKSYLFLLVFARVIGFLLFLPVIGGRQIPRQVRLFWAIVFAAMITSLLGDLPISAFPQLWKMGMKLIAEFLFGLFISVGVLIFFSCLTIAGEIIGRLGGFSIASMFNSGFNDQKTAFSQFLILFGIVIFIIIGGLNILIAGFIDSFNNIPPGEASFQSNWTLILVQLLGLSIELTFRLVAPVIATSLLIFLVIGLLGRTFPQLNVLSISFSFSTLLTFCVLFLGIGTILLCFQQKISIFLQIIFDSFSINQ
ncbi:MAG: flagellar biosynthetic protein FliR [Planctomycetia bacterium]|nr:flagellar biosynthetic protein FliR [Planctomycetia bacterium]